MSRVLVTGGLGRAGQWVVEHLLAEGYDVVCVDRHVPETLHVSETDVTFYRADLTEQGAVWELIFESDPDAVVHLASVARDSATHNQVPVNNEGGEFGQAAADHAHAHPTLTAT